MENPFGSLPEGWRQLALPSPWEGINLSHVVATSYESEFVTPAIVVSLVIEAADRCVSKDGGGRWRSLGITDGSVCCVPHAFGDRIGWHGRTESISLNIDPSWVLRGCREVKTLPQSPFHGKRDKIIAAILQEIYCDNQRGAPHGLCYSETLVAALMLRLESLSMPQTQMQIHPKSLDLPAMERARDFILANLHERLGLSEIASAAGFDGDLRTFVRTFKRFSGASPHRFITQQRMTLAKALLQQGKLNVTEVAMECGFSNVSHFSDTFRRHWDIPPSSVRLR